MFDIRKLIQKCIFLYQKFAHIKKKSSTFASLNKKNNNMKQTTINIQIVKNLGNYESVRLGGEWSIEDEDPIQAYRLALGELNTIYEDLYHKEENTPKKVSENGKARQVVEFGTPLLQSICNRITKDRSITLDTIEKYYELTQDAKKTVLLAIKMR